MMSPLGGHGPTAKKCDEVLREVFARLPDDASPLERDRRVSAAYPFRTRDGWPYRVWLSRVAVWKAEHAAGIRVPLPHPSAHPRRRRMPPPIARLFGDLFAQPDPPADTRRRRRPSTTTPDQSHDDDAPDPTE